MILDKILLVTPYYPPDLGPSAPLYGMLCEELALRGYEVSVIAAVPHYPSGYVDGGFRGKAVIREACGKVNIIRVWVPSLDRSKLWKRLVSFAAFQLMVTFVGVGENYQLLLATNPSIEVGLPLLALGIIRRKPFIYCVQDIYPDVGINVGVFKSSGIVKTIEWLEAFFMKRARIVQVISDGFRDILVRKGISRESIRVIPNWTDVDEIRQVGRPNSITSHWKLDGYFVVMYAGNIGLSQGLEQVISAARTLQTKADIRLVFVGEGGGRKALEHEVEAQGLKNVLFIPLQPRSNLPELLGAADISLVTLRGGVSANSVPSKCYSLMASGRPIIAVVDSGSETWKLVERAGCGMCVEPGDTAGLIEAVIKIYMDRNLGESMGSNGQRYVVLHHSKGRAADDFDSMMKESAGDHGIG